MDRDTMWLVYAGFLAAGGLIGFVKKGSVPSLLAGSVTAAAVAVPTLSNAHLQPLIVAGVAGLMTGVMGARFNRSGKLMPAGIVAIVSGALFLGQAYYIKNNGYTRH